MIQKIRDLLLKTRLYLRTRWDITDLLMQIKQSVKGQENPIHPTDGISYTCYRDIRGICVYIPEGKEDIIYNDYSIFNKDFNIINLNALEKYCIKRNIMPDVYANITPATVKLKCIKYIDYNNILIYVVYTVDLNHNDTLYDSLVNYNKIESKF